MPTFRVEGIAPGQPALFNTLLRVLKANALRTTESGFPITVQKDGKDGAHGIIFDGAALTESHVRSFLGRLEQGRSSRRGGNYTFSVSPIDHAPSVPEETQPEPANPYTETISYLTEEVAVLQELLDEAAKDGQKREELQGRHRDALRKIGELEKQVGEATALVKSGKVDVVLEQVLLGQKQVYTEVSLVLKGVAADFDPTMSLDKYVEIEVRTALKAMGDKSTVPLTWEDTAYAKTNTAKYTQAKKDLSLLDGLAKTEMSEELRAELTKRIGVNREGLQTVVDEYEQTAQRHADEQDAIKTVRVAAEEKYRQQKELVELTKTEEKRVLPYTFCLETGAKTNKLVIAVPLDADLKTSYLGAIFRDATSEEMAKSSDGLSLEDRSDDKMLRLVIVGDKTKQWDAGRMYLLKDRVARTIHEKETAGILFKIGYSLQSTYCEIKK